MGRDGNRQSRMSTLSWVIFRSKTHFFRNFFEVNFLDDFLIDFYRFWMDFGRVLGGQNPRFSRFFRCFFHVIFEARSGRVKNRHKKLPSTEVALFCFWIPVVPTLLGREKERGTRAWPSIKSLAFQIRPL